jgi:hypothetical protein
MVLAMLIAIIYRIPSHILSILQMMVRCESISTISTAVQNLCSIAEFSVICDYLYLQDHNPVKFTGFKIKKEPWRAMM